MVARLLRELPVRSLSSPVLRWPDATEVDGALRAWAERAAATNGDVRLIGYFGSYARGKEPFERRPARWDLTGLPVPADLLVYTEAEWASRPAGRRFHEMIEREAVCVYRR